LIELIFQQCGSRTFAGARLERDQRRRGGEGRASDLARPR
jgi:hypothetical protein